MIQRLVPIVLGLALAPVLLAQSQLERFERQLEQFQRENRVRADQNVPAEQRALFDYGGYLSLNYLSLDDQFGNNHGLRQYDLFGYGRLNLDGVHEFYLSLRGSWRDFNRGDSFDGRGDDYQGDLDRAYYRFDLARYLGAYKGVATNDNVIFTGGRQLVYWANGLTLSQVLDAAVIDISKGPVDVSLLAGVTPERTVDYDSSRPDFDRETHRGFYGAMASANLGSHRPFGYVLFQQDYNHDDALTLGLIDTRFEYYSWYIGLGSTGSIGDRLLYGLELVYEGGTTLSNSFDPDTFFPTGQTKDQVEAWAGNFRLDYLMNDIRRTRLSGEFIMASGDPDRLHSSNTFGGNQSGSRDHSFNAFGLLNTGLAFNPSVSNMIVGRVGVSTFPLPDYNATRRLQAGVDFFAFAKARVNGPIDEQTNDRRYLGVEPDVYINWQLTSDLTLVMRYGVFFGSGDAIRGQETRQFFFTGLTFSF